MAVEVWSIAALALMLVLITVIQGALVPVTQGFRWGLGSRDQPLEKSALQGRIARTVQNQTEAMLIYTPLMGLVVLLDRTGSLTEVAAWLVILGRAAFIPLYIVGAFGMRSAAYATALTGILITAWALLA